MTEAKEILGSLYDIIDIETAMESVNPNHCFKNHQNEFFPEAHGDWTKNLFPYHATSQNMRPVYGTYSRDFPVNCCCGQNYGYAALSRAVPPPSPLSEWSQMKHPLHQRLGMIVQQNNMNQVKYKLNVQQAPPLHLHHVSSLLNCNLNRVTEPLRIPAVINNLSEDLNVCNILKNTEKGNFRGHLIKSQSNGIDTKSLTKAEMLSTNATHMPTKSKISISGLQDLPSQSQITTDKTHASELRKHIYLPVDTNKQEIIPAHNAFPYATPIQQAINFGRDSPNDSRRLFHQYASLSAQSKPNINSKEVMHAWEPAKPHYKYQINYFNSNYNHSNSNSDFQNILGDGVRHLRSVKTFSYSRSVFNSETMKLNSEGSSEFQFLSSNDWKNYVLAKSRKEISPFNVLKVPNEAFCTKLRLLKEYHSHSSKREIKNLPYANLIRKEVNTCSKTAEKQVSYIFKYKNKSVHKLTDTTFLKHLALKNRLLKIGTTTKIQNRNGKKKFNAWIKCHKIGIILFYSKFISTKKISKRKTSKTCSTQSKTFKAINLKRRTIPTERKQYREDDIISAVKTKIYSSTLMEKPEWGKGDVLSRSNGNAHDFHPLETDRRHIIRSNCLTDSQRQRKQGRRQPKGETEEDAHHTKLAVMKQFNHFLDDLVSEIENWQKSVGKIGRSHTINGWTYFKMAVQTIAKDITENLKNGFLLSK